jgi:hypothetical protein
MFVHLIDSTVGTFHQLQVNKGPVLAQEPFPQQVKGQSIYHCTVDCEQLVEQFDRARSKCSRSWNYRTDVKSIIVLGIGDEKEAHAHELTNLIETMAASEI